MRAAETSTAAVSVPAIPDREIAEAYERSATQNVLAAVNSKVFPGYWSVCADGQGFGYGNTYPSLDGHQMTDALLWLGQADVVLANWDYVRRFQHPDGQLPLAILPSLAGQEIGAGAARSTVGANGGLYRHWVPGNPLRALASPTYVQNADAIFRHTQDREWLASQLASINLAADCLASLTTAEGAVGGAGYYVERPTRIEFDGVSQCHAVDAFRRVAALNRVLGQSAAAQRFEEIGERIRRHFVEGFWVERHFAEYVHPERGQIAHHGLTDVDWAALATGAATPGQREILWPQLRDEKRFYYGGMPTGISTRPETYEDWEFTHPDRHDLAAMGRVWYLECWARQRMGDAAGLADSVRRVARAGRESGYDWRERYYPNKSGVRTPAGAEKYCEYPANLIRIVQRFLLGVEFRLDGAVVLAPTVPPEFWDQGFGQTLRWRGRVLAYRMQSDGIRGEYSGNASLRLLVRLCPDVQPASVRLALNDRPATFARENGLIALEIPKAAADDPCRFELKTADC